MLARKEMEAVIAAGGSVLIGGQIISRVADLPSEADLTAAAGDPEAAQEVVTKLEAQIAALTAQVAKLTSPAPQTITVPDEAQAGEPESEPKKPTKR